MQNRKREYYNHYMIDSLITYHQSEQLAADHQNGTPQAADWWHVRLELIENLQV
jgi:hypothetical protein